LKIEVLIIGKETKTFEPIDQVVSKENQMEIGLIGSLISKRDFPKAADFEKFLNNKFSFGSLVVETPEIEGLKGEVGNNHLVGISSHLEEESGQKSFS
jgi:hypothetical protein